VRYDGVIPSIVTSHQFQRLCESPAGRGGVEDAEARKTRSSNIALPTVSEAATLQAEQAPVERDHATGSRAQLNRGAAIMSAEQNGGALFFNGPKQAVDRGRMRVQQKEEANTRARDSRGFRQSLRPIPASDSERSGA
jgi:hypothetical protein